jgi:hypothetical protein
VDGTYREEDVTIRRAVALHVDVVEAEARPGLGRRRDTTRHTKVRNEPGVDTTLLELRGGSVSLRASRRDGCTDHRRGHDGSNGDSHGEEDSSGELHDDNAKDVI